MIIPTREGLADVANSFDLKTAIEVGTHQAVFASGFMARYRGNIKLIDPWEGGSPDHPTFYPAFNPGSRDRNLDFEIAKKAMEPFGDRVEFLRMTSRAASQLIPDNSVGIIYIDALHDYASVQEDISLWYPKVQEGGIFCGHDFHPNLPGVVLSVMEFMFKNNLDINFTSDIQHSWWFIKKVHNAPASV